MKILIVRPSPTGEELAKNLNNIGISSWHFSLFYFSCSHSQNNLCNNIQKLYTSDIIVFFSKTAIYYTNLYLQKNNLKWPLKIEYYAIGQSTALFLQSYIKKKLLFHNFKKIVNLYYKLCMLIN